MDQFGSGVDPAAGDINGYDFVGTQVAARVREEAASPITATTRSLAISLETTVWAFSGSPWSSATISRIFFSKTPPERFTSSTANLNSFPGGNPILRIFSRKRSEFTDKNFFLVFGF
jgi:hypothetical protein